MSENIGNTFVSTAKKRLDTKGVVILLVSWMLAVILIVIGIVSLIPKQKAELTVNKPVRFMVEESTKYSFTFTPESSASYQIEISGATLETVKKDNQNISFILQDGDYVQDNIYILKLYQGNEYDIEVETTDTELEIVIEPIMY